MWTFVSTNPGVTNLPLPSMTSASAGTSTEARSPTAAMRSPSMTRTPSGIGAPPFPSMIVAPTMATVAGDSCAVAGGSQAGRERRATVATADREAMVPTPEEDNETEVLRCEENRGGEI